MPSRSRGFAIPAVIVAVALVALAFVILRGGGPGSQDAAAPTAPSIASAREPGVVSQVIEPSMPDRVDVERHDEADPLAMGDLHAPLTIVMFSDFQCAFCALWTQQTLPQILPYVDDGRVRIEWRDIAVFGPDSARAAYAAYAAGLQGKYYEFATALFDGGTAPSPTRLTDDALAGLALDLGLDVEKFNLDRASEQVDAALQRNFAEGVENGVFSTPAFLLNGRPIIGAQPTEMFLEEIEEELAAAR